MKRLLAVAVMLSLLASWGCTNTTAIRNKPGNQATEVDPQEDPLGGLGVDSRDVIRMCDQMMRDMLANPTLTNAANPPWIVVDSRYFTNESSQPLNKNVITDLLRTEMVRAANGRMIFLSRESANMVEEERELEKNGAVTPGTQGPTRPAGGWDYRLIGRITSIDEISSSTGEGSRYYQFTFEMIQRGSTIIVWAGAYKVKKVGRDDVTHR